MEKKKKAEEINKERKAKTEKPANECVNYTYMVRCRDGSLYTGWTNHLEERIKAHNEGRGAKYTRSRGPVELVYWEKFETRQEAMSREGKIKQLTKVQKEALIVEKDSWNLGICT